MKEIIIELEGIDGDYQAVATPAESKGMLTYLIAARDPENKPGQTWQIEIVPDCNGWMQTPESIQRGPVMPCFFVEEIGEKLEGRLK